MGVYSADADWVNPGAFGSVKMELVGVYSANTTRSLSISGAYLGRQLQRWLPESSA